MTGCGASLMLNVRLRLTVFAAESASCSVIGYLPAFVGSPENSREQPGGVHAGGAPAAIPAGKVPVIVQAKPVCDPPSPRRKKGWYGIPTVPVGKTGGVFPKVLSMTVNGI